MPDEKREYLGDGVYASFDGWHIWLVTGSHDNPDNRVALEPSVYNALVRYHDQLVKAAEEATRAAQVKATEEGQ